MGFNRIFKQLNNILIGFKTTHGTAGRRGRILYCKTKVSALKMKQNGGPKSILPWTWQKNAKETGNTRIEASQGGEPGRMHGTAGRSI